MNIDDIKKALDAKKVVIGAEETLKKIKLSKLSKVYISSNCPEGKKDDLERASKVAKIDFVVLGKTNEELGVVCKKPFSISVLSTLKD
jgi:large subunit ribosomal protein L30e|tara:strand:- start:277 stop:540 length:264 start_codon:yes stop_codon:yes gene_type:complete